MGKDLEQLTNKDIQIANKTQEKMLNIISHQGTTK